MSVLRRIAPPMWCVVVASIWLVASPLDVTSAGREPAQDELLAVPVHDGVATFDLPRVGQRDQYLIIVNSLAQRGGPFGVRVTTEPVAHPQPFESVRTAPDPAWLASIQIRRQQLEQARHATEPVRLTSAPGTPLPERTFWLMVRGDDFAQAKNYEAVQARLVSLGEHCAVYLDDNCAANDRMSELIQQTAEAFDKEVYPTAARVFGRHRDVDGDGRFAILFTPWLGRLSGGAVSLGGFVRGSDFYADLEAPLSNHCDMMYLNSELRPGPHLRTLIAHEYTHAITLSEHVFGRYLSDRSGQEEENWLDESLAHLAENLHSYSWSNLDYRISGFLSSPERYRLVVEDYYAADLWRGHGNRGSTYLFLRWCVDQFGEQILRDLVQTNLCGVANVETTTGRPFAELFRDWSAALFLSHSGLATRPEHELRYISPRSTLNGRLLAGPRHEFLDLAGETRRFDLSGTSTKYFVAHSSLGSATRVRITAEPSASLQVSVYRLPTTLARLEMKAQLADSSDPRGHGTAFQVQLSERNGTPVRLDHLAWEQCADGSNKDGALGCCGRVLSAEDITKLFGTPNISGSGTITASNIAIETLASPDQPLVLKATGRDAGDRAVSAWCVLDLRALSVERAALSANQADVKR